jgi:chromosome segregation ATPase
MSEINDCCRVHLAKMEQAQARLRHLEREHAERLERIHEMQETLTRCLNEKDKLQGRLRTTQEELWKLKRQDDTEQSIAEDQREELWEKIVRQEGEIDGLRFALECLTQKRRKP